MAGSCDARGCDQMFGPWFARRVARRYRKRGLGKTERRLVDLAAEHGVNDADVLEIGGGVGELGIELLKRGARHVTSLELSRAYDGEAQLLLAEAGVVDRVDRRIVDIAADPDDVEVADVVVMHRVVCCYPDYARLLASAADHARRVVVFSYPPRNVLSRVATALQSATFRLRGSEFRLFVHPPEAMFDVLRTNGFERASAQRSAVWQLACFTRSTDPGSLRAFSRAAEDLRPLRYQWIKRD